MYSEDTIAAIATPVGEGSVAIVRVSGPRAESLAQAVFHPSATANNGLQSHRLHHGTIRTPGSNEVLDEVLITLMRSPRSYTGEDVVEVHCHGGPFVARRILELVLSCGARHAEAGEFTKRAFLNGRLDLTQAEAIADLIRARTDKSLRLAAGQVQGKLSSWVGELRTELLEILVQVEAAIDFPEEDIELLKRQELTQKAEALTNKISIIIGTYDWGKLFREGASVCIAGRPNVGKSSLLNALLGENRAIVNASPGTTRDFIEESLNLGGLPLILWDTAGIRDSEEEVEQLGIQLSLERIKESHAVMIILDGSENITDEDLYIIDTAGNKKGLVVINKSDLPQKIDLHEIGSLVSGRDVVSVSAKLGSGIDKLKLHLRSVLLGENPESEIVVTNLRHKSALSRAGKSLAEALAGFHNRVPPEMVAVDLNEAKQAIEEIIGIVTNDDILDQIFSQFCIGK